MTPLVGKLLTAHDALFVDYDNALEQQQEEELLASQQMGRGGIRRRDSGGVGGSGGSGGGGARTGVVSASSAAASVSALSDGSYAVGYSVRQAGVWALAIELDGEAIAKSPFAVTVWPTALHAPACDVSGDLHYGVAGAAGEVTITARDRFGNRIREGGEQFHLALLPMDDPRAPTVQGDLEDHGDGRYTIRYNCRTAGRLALSITTHEGAPLYGSPFLMLVGPAPPTASRCALIAPTLGPSKGAVVLQAGGEISLGLRVYDAFGNPTPFEPRSLEIAIDEVGVPRAHGGALAPASEYTVRAVTEQPDGSASTAGGVACGSGGAGGSRENFWGSPARGSGGNGGGGSTPRSGGVDRPTCSTLARASSAPPTSPLASPRTPGGRSLVSHPKAMMSVASPHSGRADGGGSSAGGHTSRAAGGSTAGSGVLITRIYRAGEHLVHARLGAIELPGSPVRVIVEPGSVSAKNSFIAHDAIKAQAEEKTMMALSGAGSYPAGAGSVLSLRAAVLTLLTADSWSNPVAHGGASVQAKMSGPGACSTSVEDHHDGSYTVTWAAMLSGTYRLSVLLGGGHVKGSPFGVYVDVAQPGSPRLPPPYARLPGGSGSMLGAVTPGASPQNVLSGSHLGPPSKEAPVVVSCSATPGPILSASPRRQEGPRAWR